jgi:hypothetical protein
VSLSYPLRLFVTVLAYLAGRLLADSLALSLRDPRPGRLGRAMELARQWGHRLRLSELLRIGYHLLVPFAVLQLGWASPLDLGLTDLDWVSGIGRSVVWCVAALLPVLWTWRRFVVLVGAVPQMTSLLRWAEPWGWAWLVREAILLEASWSLVRSPLLLMAGPYWGVFAGFALIWLFELIDPLVRRDAMLDGMREEHLLIGSVSVVTASIFLLTRNVWLCAAAHAVVRGAVLLLLRTLQPAEGVPLSA